MKKDIKKEEKTYTVYQDNYTTGYKVYDPADECSHKPSDTDIAESFTAEEGAEWFGCLNETIHIEKDDMEEAGYTVEQLDDMSETELYDAVYDILTDPEKEFSDWENGALINECDEDKPNEAYDIEDVDDEVVVTVVVKYKFTMCDGEVKSERVK